MIARIVVPRHRDVPFFVRILMNPVPAAPFTDSQATKLPVLDQLKSFSNSCYCFHGSLSPCMRSILIALPLYVISSHWRIRHLVKRLHITPQNSLYTNEAFPQSLIREPCGYMPDY